jgi:enamine deaminase RidA (YjgF/YER057c/UK114 family)
MTIQRQQTDKRMSQSVIHQSTVYLSGQVAQNVNGGIEQQTLDILEQIQKLLASAGSDLEHILSVTIYLKDIERDFSGMNAVWDRWLPMGSAPARATVEATMCESNILVEMSVIAALAA